MKWGTALPSPFASGEETGWVKPYIGLPDSSAPRVVLPGAVFLGRGPRPRKLA